MPPVGFEPMISAGERPAALVKLRKMQCVKSAKDESYGPVSVTFRNLTTIAQGNRDGSSDQCQVL